MGGTSVCLLLVPFEDITLPSLRTALLRGYLEEAGISSRVLCGNLVFAQDIGLDAYIMLSGTLRSYMMQEWIFGGAAFPGHPSDDEHFFEHWSKYVNGTAYNQLSALHRGIDMPALLRLIRERAVVMVDRLAREALNDGPRVVACSILSGQHAAALAVLRRIKELSPTTVTMMGGGGCLGTMGRTIKDSFPYVDFVVSGEADGFFVSLCRDLIEGRRPSLDANNARSVLPVLGATSPSTASGFVDIAVQHDMDACARPIFDDYYDTVNELGFARYFEPPIPIETSRGCWWGAKHHCTFCGISDQQMKYRAKSPSRVLSELDELSARYKSRRFFVVDNILSHEYYENVLPALGEEGRDYVFFFESKSNLKERHFQLLQRAGVRMLQPGMESLHSKGLELIDKGVTGIQQIQTLRLAEEYGIDVQWNYLVCAPGEQDDWHQDVASWIKSIFHLRPPNSMTPIQFYRFSPYFEKRSAFGLDLVPDPDYARVFPLSEEKLFDFAYFFVGRNTPKNEEVLDAMWYGRWNDALLADNAGLIALYHELVAWKRLRLTDGAPNKAHGKLTASTNEVGQVVVTDTRPCATVGSCVLSDLEAAVLLACSEAKTIDNLARAVHEQRPDAALTPESLEPTLSSLIERRWLLKLDGRYLRLVVWPRASWAWFETPAAWPVSITHDELLTTVNASGLLSRAKRLDLRQLIGELMRTGMPRSE